MKAVVEAWLNDAISELKTQAVIPESNSAKAKSLLQRINPTATLQQILH